VHKNREKLFSKILIVEDEEGVEQLWVKLFSVTHEIQTFSDGRKAVEQFVPGEYDVALTDLGIPGIPGDQVAKQVRREKLEIQYAEAAG